MKVDDVWRVPLRTANGGWIPCVESDVEFKPGAGDGKVMNYHFRVTVTKAAERIPFPCPEGYDEGRFEILARYFHQYPESTMRRIVGFISNPSGRYRLDSSGNTVVQEGDKWELNNHQASILSLGHLGGQFSLSGSRPGWSKSDYCRPLCLQCGSALLPLRKPECALAHT